MSTKPVVIEGIPESLVESEAIVAERKDKVIVNPHVRAALDDKTVLARDSQNAADAHDTFLAWTRGPS